jgi:hypothetical protein
MCTGVAGAQPIYGLLTPLQQERCVLAGLITRGWLWSELCV